MHREIFLFLLLTALSSSEKWSEWSPCSATCGMGTRERFCVNRSCGQDSEAEPCSMEHGFRSDGDGSDGKDPCRLHYRNAFYKNGRCFNQVCVGEPSLSTQEFSTQSVVKPAVIGKKQFSEHVNPEVIEDARRLSHAHLQMAKAEYWGMRHYDQFNKKSLNLDKKFITYYDFVKQYGVTKNTSTHSTIYVEGFFPTVVLSYIIDTLDNEIPCGLRNITRDRCERVARYLIVEMGANVFDYRFLKNKTNPTWGQDYFPLGQAIAKDWRDFAKWIIDYELWRLNIPPDGWEQHWLVRGLVVEMLDIEWRKKLVMVEALLLAVGKNDFDMVSYMTEEKGMSIKATTGIPMGIYRHLVREYPVQPLIAALVHDRYDMIRWLLKKGADPLHPHWTAMIDGQLLLSDEVIKILVEEGGVDINTDFGGTLLYGFYRYHKNYTRMTYMIDNLGADVNFRFSSGNSLLRVTVFYQDAVMVKFLLTKRAKIFADNGGSTQLDFAIEKYKELLKKARGTDDKNEQALLHYKFETSVTIIKLLSPGETWKDVVEERHWNLMEEVDEILEICLGSGLC